MAPAAAAATTTTTTITSSPITTFSYYLPSQFLLGVTLILHPHPVSISEHLVEKDIYRPNAPQQRQRSKELIQLYCYLQCFDSTTSKGVLQKVLIHRVVTPPPGKVVSTLDCCFRGNLYCKQP